MPRRALISLRLSPLKCFSPPSRSDTAAVVVLPVLFLPAVSSIIFLRRHKKNLLRLLSTLISAAAAPQEQKHVSINHPDLFMERTVGETRGERAPGNFHGKWRTEDEGGTMNDEETEETNKRGAAR